MRDHFEMLSKINAKRQKFENDFLVKMRENEEDKRYFMGFLTHCCDLSGSMKKFPESREWSIRVSQEFSAQCKEEQELDLPVTPYMKDLDNKAVMAKQEIGFLTFVTLPLWKLANESLNNQLEHLVSNVEQNIAEWKKEIPS
eukprot:TRINITY_DN9085_c0_g1_i1.p1 TRINITY_DN9085_c0_g1~~TRINITY_DN9085_c0_g1_i1.p1  ORF type:complete len:142 (-),score=28.67 TRINITY_DN9085_c0_g1_i1:140-565(-)